MTSMVERDSSVFSASGVCDGEYTSVDGEVGAGESVVAPDLYEGEGAELVEDNFSGGVGVLLFCGEEVV